MSLRNAAAVLAAVLWVLGLPAAAQSYPTRPIKLIVPYSVGTPPDIVSRLVGDRMSVGLAQPVLVETRPGATGTVGLNELTRQPADGYTLYNMLMPVSVAPALYPSLALDFKKAMDPVGQFTWYYNVLVVHPEVKAASVQDLVQLLKAPQATYSFASGGNGTPAHLSGELFKLQAQVRAQHVPYNQFPQGIADLVAGRIQFMFLTSSVSVPLAQSGKLRALAVTGGERLPALPAVPTMVELGYKDFLVRGWDGFVVRAGTPRAIVERLNAEMARAV
ncbi:MAG: Bug family tripartite tricarboxylate transporter substrate binding protein, partial [Betaproteobacteria bacterium]